MTAVMAPLYPLMKSIMTMAVSWGSLGSGSGWIQLRYADLSTDHVKLPSKTNEIYSVHVLVR